MIQSENMLKINTFLHKLLLATIPVAAYAAEQTAIVGVKTYGFVDLEGAKVSVIIVEYAQEIKGESVDASKFEITDYVIQQERLNGYDAVIETDLDAVKGNEGRIERVYANTRPEPSLAGGTKQGRYAIIEVNTAYVLAAQNLIYQMSMIADVTQIGVIEGVKGMIPPNSVTVGNYTMEERRDRLARDRWLSLQETASFFQILGKDAAGPSIALAMVLSMHGIATVNTRASMKISNCHIRFSCRDVKS